MNDPDLKTKQQIVEKIKSSTNILITVSRNPSVDDLSAALGLTTLLNKLEKHATAIFSGAVPAAINFLEPDKTFETNADSLRDFIIALDKEKADHLRYKVDGDVVKIFITPYRTTISSDDLEFTQGDYNVELVIALGVDNQEHLDEAITAHGSVLSNVTIATFTNGDNTSQLGTLGWHDKNASSLCEMVVGLSDSLKTDKSLLDQQISTALLTGIVAATDRFSNENTSSRIMTTAAQLMAAGANQQLIAAQLQEAHEISSLTVNPSEQISTNNTSTIPSDDDVKSPSLAIKHDEPVVETTSTLPPETMSTLPPEIKPIVVSKAEGESAEPKIVSPTSEPSDEPSLGGTLNATADQAAEDARREAENDQNKTILSHNYMGGASDIANQSVNSLPPTAEPSGMVDLFAASNPQPSTSTLPPEPMISTLPPQPTIQPPAGFDIPLPPPPPMPDFSTLPNPVTSDFSTVSPSPVTSQNFAVPPVENASFNEPSSSVIDNPSQFRIPGQ